MTAVARHSDPATSHEAAASLTNQELHATAQLVLATIRLHGPCTDDQLVGWLAGRVSPSGARTRRNELVTAGLIADSGDTVQLVSGRSAIVWTAVAQVEQPDLFDGAT